MSKDATIDHIACIEELCRAMRSAGIHPKPVGLGRGQETMNDYEVADLRTENAALIKRNRALEAEREELLATIAFLHACIPAVAAPPTGHGEAIVSGDACIDVHTRDSLARGMPTRTGRRFLDARASLPMTEPSLVDNSSVSSVVESTQELLVFGEGSMTPTNFLLIVHKAIHGCAPPRAVIAKQKLIDAYLDNISAAYPGVRIEKKKIIGVRAK